MKNYKQKIIDWISIERNKRKGGLGGLIYEDDVKDMLSEYFNINEVKIKEECFHGKYSKYAEWFFKLMFLPNTANYLVKTDFDVITAPSFRAAAKEIAIIHHIDNSFLPKILSPVVYLLEKLFYHNLKRYDAVVVVSEYWKQNFLKKSIKNVHKIYNSFNLEDFSISQKDVESFRQKFQLKQKPIIYIGTCQKSKGVVQTYAALKDLDVYLVTSGGKGVELGAINLDLNYHEYLCLLKASSVVVAMSLIKEGWCRTAHEAMLCKTPVIGSGRGGMRELLAGGGQIICEDFNKLKEKVEYLLNNSKIREKMAETGYEYAKQFTKEKFVSDWQELIKNLIKYD
jgi:glycosyltransferase involved in cell wall biosynthesis